jgi:hypothetical protein
MQYYVQDVDGIWHVRSLHPMGLVKVKGKHQLHFPTTGKACPECRALLHEAQREKRYMHPEPEAEDA